MFKKCVSIIVCILIGGVLFFGTQRLLMPKYVTDIQEGSMIEEYYKDSKNNDVIIIGNCQAYENISPVTMWEEYGITSYIRGSADQYIWQSYYILEETLRYETPKVVVMSVHSLANPRSVVEEPYNRMTIDGMKWSSSKINAIKASMTEGESMISYIFPIARFHSRWSELSSEDFKYYFSKPAVTTKGYLMHTEVRPVTTEPRVPVLANGDFPEENVEYLRKAAALCKEKGVELVLVKTPSVFPHWYDEYEQQVEEFAKVNELLYINAIEDNDKIGIDYSVDTSDSGQHLNVYGAEKFSKYLGQVLVSEYGLAGHKDEESVVKEWNQVSDRYYKEKEEKIKEWKERQ